MRTATGTEGSGDDPSGFDQQKNSEQGEDGQNRQEDRGMVLRGAGGGEVGGVARAAHGSTPGDGDPTADAAVVEPSHGGQSSPGEGEDV